MGRPLRYQPDGFTVYEVTTRTVHGRFLLRPSDRLNDLILGVLGRAQEKFEFELYAFVVMSNHYGMLIGVPDVKELSALMCFINSNIAREAGRLHRWRDKLWRRRFRAIPVLDDESQVDRLRYITSNGVKEGLIDRPDRWPGAHSVGALLRGEKLCGIWIDRAALYRARRKKNKDRPVTEADFTTRYPVKLSPLPCWAHLGETERRDLYRCIVIDVTQTAREENERLKRRPLGPKAILEMDPHDRPERSDHSPAPACHAVCPKRRRAWAEAYRAFVDAYHAAVESLRRGIRAFDFPDGCIPPGTPLVPRAARPAHVT